MTNNILSSGKNTIELVDTHCHIHEAETAAGSDNPTRALWLRADKPDPDEMLRDASNEGVAHVICVGTTTDDSAIAVKFAQSRPGIWASVGIHPHEAKDHINNTSKLEKFSKLLGADKVVAIGECGLDYYYEHSPRKDQRQLLVYQMEQAGKHGLPLIFHIREAFADFWSIVDDFQATRQRIKGVIHSFTATTKELEQALSRGFYVGLNGIMTFTKDAGQLEAAKAVPLERLLLETDAPFLTPAPFRGKICQPKHVRVTAEFLADIRGESLLQLSAATSVNAKELFNLE